MKQKEIEIRNNNGFIILITEIFFFYPAPRRE